MFCLVPNSSELTLVTGLRKPLNGWRSLFLPLIGHNPPFSLLGDRGVVLPISTKCLTPGPGKDWAERELRVGKSNLFLAIKCNVSASGIKSILFSSQTLWLWLVTISIAPDVTSSKTQTSKCSHLLHTTHKQSNISILSKLETASICFIIGTSDRGTREQNLFYLFV